ncbi:MAG: hypothetical protein U0838_11400 [Chloroflexota bacterium]
MVEDPLDTVLRLVVEGRLTAEEAGPILAALDAKPVADRSAPAPEPEPAAAGANGGRSLRIEVRDGGRTVVNLRLPLALGRHALDRVPALRRPGGAREGCAQLRPDRARARRR